MRTDHFTKNIAADFYLWGNPNTYPRDPLRYVEILERVQGMTTPATMHMLNRAVACLEGDECYLEVGTWRGATLIGALLGNAAPGYAIDNDTMDEHDDDARRSADVWRENIAAAGMTDRATYFDASVPAVWAGLAVPPVGVYLFDGDKRTIEAAYEGLSGVVPFLAPRALIFADDANQPEVRRAVYRLQVETFPRASIILDIPTPGNCWASFWNGLIIMQWDAEARL